jgi:hypothetical protein
MLEKKPSHEQHDLRLKLRGLVADIVERIDIAPYRNGRQVEARITIFAKQELSARHLAVDTAKPLEEVKNIMAGFRPVARRHQHAIQSLARQQELTIQEQGRLKRELLDGKKELDKAELKALEKELGTDAMRKLRRLLADKGIKKGKVRIGG